MIFEILKFSTTDYKWPIHV